MATTGDTAGPTLVEFPATKAEPIADVTQHLVDLVDASEDGNVRSFTYAIIDADGKAKFGWAWEKGIDAAKIAGAIRLLDSQVVKLLSSTSLQHE